MDGAGRRAERDRDGEGAAGGEGRQHETGGAERDTRGQVREHRTGGGEVSERSDRIGRWLDGLSIVFTSILAVLICACVYFAFYFAVILMEEAK